MHSRKLRMTICFVALLISLLVLIVVNMLEGSVSIPLNEVLRIILTHDSTLKFGVIIWNIRLPRIISAILLGGALSVSGYLLQSFFANPIAGPYVLGISSGAKLAVAIVMIGLLKIGSVANSLLLISAAFVGSMLSMGFVLLISERVKKMSILIICGVMIGYICSAITEFLVTFADDNNIVNLHNWSMGSFSGINWSNIGVIIVVTAIGVIGAFLVSKPLIAYQLGEEYALSMGVNVHVLRAILILLSSLLSACVTAFAGPISFVGIAVPHLVRRFFKTSDARIVIPASFLCGASFCLLCDLIAKMIFAPIELSISSVTALIGAPIVISIMIGRQNKRHG